MTPAQFPDGLNGFTRAHLMTMITYLRQLLRLRCVDIFSWRATHIYAFDENRWIVYSSYHWLDAGGFFFLFFAISKYLLQQQQRQRYDGFAWIIVKREEENSNIQNWFLYPSTIFCAPLIVRKLMAL